MEHSIDPEFSGQLMSSTQSRELSVGRSASFMLVQMRCTILAGSPEAGVKGGVLLGREKRTLSASEPFPHMGAHTR